MSLPVVYFAVNLVIPQLVLEHVWETNDVYISHWEQTQVSGIIIMLWLVHIFHLIGERSELGGVLYAAEKPYVRVCLSVIYFSNDQTPKPVMTFTCI